MRTKISCLLTVLLLLIGYTLTAQTKTISGNVTDQSGLPLPGVNILVKGTTIGTQTDFDGNYSITAREGQELEFSFLGQKTVYRMVGSSNTINVQMEEDAQTLEEVVVTGVAGATTKAKLAISAASVSEDLLQSVPATSAASAIQGKVAGVNVVQPSGLPGSSASITIRGATSLLGNQNPLIIVDGVLLGNANLADINTEDVKSYEILKGAAAASLYGSRAANGVIQIITKRGQRNSDPRVTIRQEVGLATILNAYSQSRFHNYRLNPDGSFVLSDPADALSLVVDIPNGQTSNHSIIDNAFPVYYDSFDSAFGNGLFRTFSASVSGGSEKINYYVSIQDNANEGIVKVGNLGYKRQVGKMNLDFDISEKFKFSNSSSYAVSRSKEPSLGSGGPLYALQFTPPHLDLNAVNDEDGSPYNWNSFMDNANGGWPTAETNPLYYLDNYKYEESRKRLISNSKLKYILTEWLYVEGSYGVDELHFRSGEFVDKNWLDDQISAFANGYISQGHSSRKYETIAVNSYTNNSFGDLELKTRLQYMQEVDSYYSVGVVGTELSNNGVNNLENVLQEQLNVGSSRTKESAKSYSAIVNLVFKERYIFDGLLRYEQVSTYGPNVREQMFYRLSGAYRLGMDMSVDWMDELKLRLSYGTAGLRPTYIAQYETVDVQDGNNTKTIFGNANLGASVSTELEFGLDFDFLKRYRLSFNYSATNNDDLVIPVPLAAATGFQEQYQNAASIESTVYEVTFGADIIKSDDVNWGVNFNFSKFDSEITSFNRSELQVGPSNSFILREGERYGTFYGKRFLTALNQLPDSEDPADYKIYNGIVVANDGTNLPQLLKDKNGNDAIVAIGNTTPDFTLSFNTRLNWKNFSLFALMDWQQGGEVYNQTKQWRFRELLHPEIDGETVGWASGVYAINAVNDYFVEDGTFVKLRELSLSYDFKNEWLKNTFISSLSVGVVGRNLFVLTNYSGVDPEVTNIDTGSDGRFNDINAYKFDAFGYPSIRTFTGVITLKF
ncbi:MAG: SusC/RagA family TonB-linked outer membrane protein [Flavobacteriaceae bacterium]|nr:SusC/RagA family TonB-linked outer membrane protein [Flavobacteriaceae bacterium]